VQDINRRVDLVLSYPQWQGSGRSEHLRRGALAAAGVCGLHGPMAVVPDAGEGCAENGIERWSAILEQFHSAHAILAERQPDTILTAGGDCACDIAVIDYLYRRYPDLTVIWVDAHLDANTAETSPSGNFHGMPVAAILGSPPAGLRGVLSALPASQFRYVSADVGDEGDWMFQKAQGLSWLDESRLPSGPVHVHFDLDSLDPAEFPHLAYPEGKLKIEAGLSLVRRIAAAGKLVGLTITEFAPASDADAVGGSVFLKSLCEAALNG
jgi:arginase